LALNFPDNPTVDQIYSDSTSGYYFKWDGVVWQSFTPGSSANIRILNDFSGSFNGVTTSFALTSGTISIIPANSQQLVINLGGVVQDPSDDYSVSGSNIIFSTPPNNGLTFSGISLGPAIPISDIVDGSVLPQDLSTGGPWWTPDYKVGIGTSVPTSLLDVEGDAIISGILTASSTRTTTSSSTSIQSTNINATGIVTANNVSIGAGNTTLIVQGDVRITGILTVGTASITFDGTNNRINVGSGITFNGSTGIISATEFRGNGANLTGVQPFPSGTLMLFQQTSSPTGWTKQTDHNNKALRVVSGNAGSGGSVAFTTAFTSRTPSGTVGGTTLSTTQIPSHTHSGTTSGVGDHAHTYGGGGETLGPGNGTISDPLYSLTTGGAGAHNHTFTTNASGGGGSHDHGFTGTAMDFAVQYVDLIIAAKD
jgi:hypothetical protein